MNDGIRETLGPLRHVLEQVDMIRRDRGRWLSACGFGPIETPSRTVRTWPRAELRAYDDAGGTSQQLPTTAVALIVPAPIKQAYVWDLAPEVSAVRRMQEAALRVYLLRWTEPEHGAAEGDDGLATYAESLIVQSLDAIAVDCGCPSPVVIAGHSLGGTLAAIFTALHPERVLALVLLEAPVSFEGPAAGAFAPMLRAAPPADEIVAALGGQVPGSFLDLVTVAAAPDAFQWEPLQDAMMSLYDPLALRTHLQIVRWTLDEFPLPGRLFVQVVEDLYRGDRFIRSTLHVGGRLASPANITAPVLVVFNPHSRVIPPSSIARFIDALPPNADAQALHYEGDIGVAVQHVGVLVGHNAHRRLWPVIQNWLRQRCQNNPKQT